MSGSRGASGQALIETLVSMPVLILIVFSTFLVGASFFTGYRASNALRAPLQERHLLANQGAVNAGVLQGMVNAVAGGTFTFDGMGTANVDGLTLAGTGNVTAFLNGQKAMNANSPLFPNFQFALSQGIDARLLEANNGVAVATTVTTPGGFNLVSPVAFGLDLSGGGLPQIPITDNCAGGGNLQLANVDPGPGGYALTEFASPSAAPPAGGIGGGVTAGSQMYLDVGALQALAIQPNTACDDAATQADWTAACQAEFAAANPDPVVDPVTGFFVDAVTGLPQDPVTGSLVDPVTGFPVDDTTGFPTDPVSGTAYDPATGFPIDPITGAAIDPVSGMPSPTAPAPLYDPATVTPGDPSATVAANAAAEGDFITGCVTAKTNSCKTYYANEFINAAVQQLSGLAACQAAGTGGDVAFPTGQPYPY